MNTGNLLLHIMIGINKEVKLWKNKGEKIRGREVVFLIDHIIICFAFAMLGMVEVFVKTDFELFWKLYYIFLLAFMFIYFFKDVINGQSIEKE